MKTLQEREFQKRIAKIEQLVGALDQIPDPELQANTKELVQLVLDLHGGGLERVLEIIDANTAAQPVLEQLAQDELVSSLLLLHGLHPLSLETRVLHALDQVRPYMQSHGGNVELLQVTEDGAVKLRLEGSCHGCPSSRVTLRYAVEEAIAATAPDVTVLEVEGVVQEPPSMEPGFIPASQLTTRKHSPHGNGNGHATKNGAQAVADGWVQLQPLPPFQANTLRVTDVQGTPILFCRVGESLYAYASHCPNCLQSLDHAQVTDKTIRCAVCGHSYAITRAGRDVDDANKQLAPFPLLQEKGGFKIALGAADAFVHA